MALGREANSFLPRATPEKETNMPKTEVHPLQNILDALDREKAGYERRADASDDKDFKARMATRVKAVDKELARVKKAETYTPGEGEAEEEEAAPAA